MKNKRIIYSLDIETTGLDPSSCQIIEIGCIAFDLDKPQQPLSEMPRFHTYVTHDQIVGQPFALHLHSEILNWIAVEAGPWTYRSPDAMVDLFHSWVGLVENDNRFTVHCVMLAGSFDERFLDVLPRFKDRFNQDRQVLRPSSLFFDPTTDNQMPGMRDCMMRAAARIRTRWGDAADTGLDGHSVINGTLVDAALNIQLLRAAWDIQEG